MSAKQILFNENAREAMKKGIDKLAEAVRMTLGPRGRAAVIEKSYGAPQVTFDGVTVAKEIELQDKYENLGAEFIKQAADKTNDKVGDGTSTAVVLAHAMIEEGERAIKEKGFNVIQLAEELKKGSEAVLKALEAQKEEINDNKKIHEVATLSAKDSDIGKLIADVMAKVGKEGVVTIEDSNTIGNAYDLVEGMQFDRGFISPYMISDQEKMEAVLEDPYILVTDKKISAISDFIKLLEEVVQTGKKELVIIADEVDGEALATLVVNKIRGVFNILAVKAPGFGDRRKEMLQDIAMVAGANFISEDLGKKLENVHVADLGRAHRVIADKDNTTIVGGKGAKKAIEERVAQIKAQIQKTDSEYEKKNLKERVGKLAGGVAVIKVGAPTESAQKELKQRVEDAVSATRAAMEEGIVPGGGMALFNVSISSAGAKENEQAVVKASWAILKRALEAPVSAIVANSGEPIKVVEELRFAKSDAQKNWTGFNAITNKIGDLKEAGIIDPLKVTKTAFINAISVAANYLTIGAAITEIPAKKETPAGGGMGGGHMDY
ncbi:chaperonin GroL [Candidatus Giovannonibacteria bacterium RIFCSPLOWO2_01_FULL_43_160]|uniref:60 kDa chaperonin n=1 Tax=Candidatus Giovannonibacteria bacterium RIFCSPLOWO2_12_FULL_43_26 TaxID=1798363 RepID=A0A1F5XYV5_9BACT|nr:MAG: 60 kDa chaperonin [Candidatus Giovannonibacteria bacterium GW2011_GWA1_43_15]KKT21236.1 MAG: 60 kDa chaperonin [Candidatus Giovannonibacteria bacterium GW2011_GWC2_43_8]OGF71896.1 MAG: chaperonin GroL [Candidatus Giovannonibacteria bacterium RIFCSPHIGHO2_12_FULL_44_22]OGF75292.1 MAG: chaperonin GroL [Candidatus Giovannonibacteria bacterium RIFCSPLOWO2_01_FULL_43_160]OGF86505.1 MAG: chaperonin GroL [Candidatus Giovannonibacteria bacterium RIFCSPLOWO2_02_FULL_43_37]OGF92731.1 MAG: chaper